VLRLPDPQPSPSLKVITAAHPAAPLKVRTATMTRVAAAPTVTAPAKVKLGTTATLTAVPTLTINPSVLIVDHKGRSQDRFCDFENGVVFWRRGASAASQLAPRAKAPNGAKMAWTAAEAANLAGVRIRQALGSLPGATVGAAVFAGTTGYSFDGAGVHNRAHRLRVTLIGKRAGMPTIPSVAIVEVRVEFSFDPVDREIVAYLTSWSLASSQGDFHGGGSLVRALHARLDPAMWKEFLVAKVPGTANDPIAVLSVKTHADGRIAVYFEP
jgi:hypothetical protein